MTENYDGNPAYRYQFEYFRLLIDNICYDGNCGGLWDPDCSEIIPTLNYDPAINNCWYGTVTIQYPTGPDAVFVVEPNANPDEDVYDELYWIEEHTWEAPGPGIYEVTIIYEGDESVGIGTNCETTVEANFMGGANVFDAIGFYDDHWWNGDYYEDEFLDAYFGAWRCGKECNPSGEPIYILNTDLGECDFDYNYQFTYFNYQPVDYDNACNSGGLLTIMAYDADGNAEVTEVVIPPNSAVNQASGLGYQPFEGPDDQWCMQSGWCLFDANEVYQLDDVIDQPLLATWFNPASCEDIDWNEIDCEDTGCIFGECIDGECVEDPEECLSLIHI